MSEVTKTSGLQTISTRQEVALRKAIMSKVGGWLASELKNIEHYGPDHGPTKATLRACIAALDNNNPLLSKCPKK